MSGRRLGLGVLVLAGYLASSASPAGAFGTIDSAGQHREHERITRASLSCSAAAGSGPACLEAASMDVLAGRDREFGAVGAPDSDEVFDPAAHCDGADFLEGGYPRTRACATLDAFGRVLHGVQDFYSHSNWADEADPTRSMGEDNPPGLGLPAPSPVLDLRGDTPPEVPPALSTGCFVLRDEVPGVGECEGRVTHAALNKDNGLIDPDTGEATDPTTPRGMVGDDFARAVAGAVEETRRQWRDLQAELAVRYGEDDASVMTCALTHDDPVDDCQDRGWSRVLIGGLSGAAVLAVLVLVFHARRRPA
jgi:hypothetical protein